LLHAGPISLPVRTGAIRTSGNRGSDAPDELLDAVVRLLRLLDGPGPQGLAH